MQRIPAPRALACFVTLVLGLVLPLVVIGEGSIGMSLAQEPQDFEARARLRAEQAERERSLKELREAAAQISNLSKRLVEEAAGVDGYTTSVSIIEAANSIEDLANEIEELAKRVRSRAQGGG
jgi:hypothetical protein